MAVVAVDATVVALNHAEIRGCNKAITRSLVEKYGEIPADKKEILDKMITSICKDLVK